MKNRLKLAGLWGLVFWALLGSCQKPIVEPVDDTPKGGRIEIQALAEAITPAELSFVWSGTDTLALYPNGQVSGIRFNIQRGLGSAQAQFVGEVPDAVKTLVGLYPYSARTTAGLRGKELNLQLPETQTYVAGKFDKNAFPMVAVSSNTESLSFKNLGAVLCLSLTGSATVSSIRLVASDASKRLSGAARVKTDFSGAPALEMQSEAKAAVTLTCKSGVALSETAPVKFYVVLPPGSYRGGFSLEVTTYTGTVTLSLEEDIILERSRVVSTPTLVCNPGGEVGPDNVPYNQIWYTTSDQSLLTVRDKSTNQELVGNEYGSDGWGKLIFSGPVTAIGDYAFSDHLITDIRLPHCVEKIGERAFSSTSLTAFCTPESLSQVGQNTFLYSTTLTRFYGKWASADETSIILADGTLVAYAPGLLDGIIEIPQGAVALADHLFFRDSNIREVILPNGLRKIGDYAFWNEPLLEKVTLSGSVQEVGHHAFAYCTQLREFDGPNSMIRDGRSLVDATGTLVAVASQGLTEYTVPVDVKILGSGVLVGVSELQSITFTGNLETTYSDFLSDCRKLEFFYGTGTTEDHHCLVLFGDYLARTTPVLPEEYTVPDGIRRIFVLAFRENTTTKRLVIPDEVYAIDSYCFYSMSNLTHLQLPSSLQEVGAQAFMYCRKLEHLYLRSEIPPVYPKDDESSYFGHNGLTIHVPENCERYYMAANGWSDYAGYIKPYRYTDLPESEIYHSTDFSQDGKVIQLQRASKGKGINVVLMGDAFSDRQMSNGIYDNVMQQMLGAFFSEEPFASCRDMFTVYAVKVVSPSEGYRDNGQALGTWFGEGTEVGGNKDKCLSYAYKAISKADVDNALLIVAMNSTKYAGTCDLQISTSGDYGCGLGVAYLPLCGGEDVFAQVLSHEAGGHGFAKLADEYSSREGEIPAAEKKTITDRTPYGWWKNIDLTGSAQNVKWKHFLQDSRYKNDGLGCFEGAWDYSKGAWRATEQSIMRYNEGGFNAPSREAIWYRIHKLAYGEEWDYSYEDFVSYDAKNRKSATKAPHSNRQLPPLPAPRITDAGGSAQ